MTKPNARPARPDFSSGPCAKRPGWTPEALGDAAVGRSHRSKVGKEKIVEAVDRTRSMLGIPADYRIGIVPASDTGAVEMALWSLLGARAGRPAGLGKLRRGLGHRRRQAAQAQGRARAQGAVRPDRRPRGGRLGARRGLHLERHDLGREGAERRLDRRRSPGAGDLRRHVGGVRDGPAVAKLDVITWSWQKVMGGEGAHGMLVLSPRAIQRLESYSPPGRCRRSSA